MHTVRLLVPLLCAPVLAMTVSAAPAAAEPRVVHTSFTIAPGYPRPVPGSLHESGPVMHYDVLEVSTTSGGGWEFANSGLYRCVQVGDRLTCQGEIISPGSIAGVGSGVISTHAAVTCELTTFTCRGRAQVKGVSGALADVRGTATSTSSLAEGGGSLTVRLTRT